MDAFVHSFKKSIHSFISLSSSFERLSSAYVWFDNQQKGSAFFVLERDHFILGDELPITQSTSVRAIICLKKILSNTRLDRSRLLQIGY